MAEEDVRRWWKQAEHDLQAAQKNLKIEEYALVAFLAHQATEKGLKALYIEKEKELLKIHDLVLLARKVNAPEKIVLICSKINPSYIDTRYPDTISKYSKEDAQELIEQAREVLEWIKKSLL